MSKKFVGYVICVVLCTIHQQIFRCIFGFNVNIKIIVIVLVMVVVMVIVINIIITSICDLQVMSFYELCSTGFLVF